MSRISDALTYIHTGIHVAAVKARGLQPRDGGALKRKKEKKKEKRGGTKKNGCEVMTGREEEDEEERGAVLKIRNANSIMTHSFPRPGKRAPHGKMSSVAN